LFVRSKRLAVFYVYKFLVQIFRRMSRTTFEFVLSIIAQKLRKYYPGLEMISLEKQFLIAI